MIDVLVTGAAGRMGSLSATTIAAQADMRLVALVDPIGGPRAGEAPAFKAVDDALRSPRPTAALEFSVPGAVFANAKALLEAGVPTVVGATGLTDEQAGRAGRRRGGGERRPRDRPQLRARAPCSLMRFAAEAARHYEHAEIIELHTRRASWTRRPGTSLRTAQLMAGPGSALRAPAGRARLARSAGGHVTIHSVRLPGLVAHQEVLFGGDDELLTIRHDSFSRRSFMAGVLLALRRVGDLHETVVGLEHLL